MPGILLWCRRPDTMEFLNFSHFKDLRTMSRDGDTIPDLLRPFIVFLRSGLSMPNLVFFKMALAFSQLSFRTFLILVSVILFH